MVHHPAARISRAVLALGLAAGIGSPRVTPAQASGGGASPQELVKDYEPKSMLSQAHDYAVDVIANPRQWNPYIDPEPKELTKKAAEFLTIYPRSYLSAEGKSILGSLADPALWDALQKIGITLMHPIAIEQAGWLKGTELQPSIDGGFDRISMSIEPQLGTEDEVRNLTKTAQDHGALIAGDIIPLHLGLGYDFRLAEMGYEDYPGIFDMIEVPEEHWDLLPDVSDPWGFQVIHNDQAQPLIDAGIMPGKFDVLLGWPESTDWSGWAATGPVKGVDGKTRRWIYAHLFKPQQPTLNWMDPTYNARKTQAGDVVRHVYDLGITVDRLDAVPFLALNPESDSNMMTYFSLQLAIAGTEDLAYLHRKLGGWTWVELNVPTGDFKRYMPHGPDLGYDFFTRAQTVHPLITGDARILRIAHRSVIQGGVDHSRLIHALQNHDEIAYQLINLRNQDSVQYGDETLSGKELGDRILKQMQDAVAPPKAPYNALYRPEKNGIATTFAGFIAPALGIDPYHASEDQVNTIRDAHVMLAVVSAMQPGVFALSQWDLVGALPIDRSKVQDRISNGDFRWLDRGAVDLMGASKASESPFGLPKADALYGPIPKQLQDPNSFVSRVAKIIKARKAYQISDAEIADVPDVSDNADFVLVMKLPDEVGGVAVTAANYSQKDSDVTVDLSKVAKDVGGLSGTPHEIISDADMGSLSGDKLSFKVKALSGVTIVIGAKPAGSSGSGSSSGLRGGFGG